MAKGTGRRPCIEDGSPPRTSKIRPAGAVIIIIVYWLGKIPALNQWHNVEDLALHAALVAMSVHVLTHVPAAALRYALRTWQVAKAIGQNVVRATRRSCQWVGDHVEVAVRVRLGPRLAEEN